MSNDFDFDPNAAPEPSPSITEEAPPSESEGKGKKKKKKKKPARKKREKVVSSRDTGPKPKQWNVFTVMLLITLLCLSIGSLLLYFELTTYGSFPWWKTDGA